MVVPELKKIYEAEEVLGQNKTSEKSTNKKTLQNLPSINLIIFPISLISKPVINKKQGCRGCIPVKELNELPSPSVQMVHTERTVQRMGFHFPTLCSDC